MTLSEIFSPPTKDQITPLNDAGEEDVTAGETEGETQIRENIKQALANNKTGGEGNAWMKMMNLCVALLAFSSCAVTDA